MAIWHITTQIVVEVTYVCLLDDDAKSSALYNKHFVIDKSFTHNRGVFFSCSSDADEQVRTAFTVLLSNTLTDQNCYMGQ